MSARFETSDEGPKPATAWEQLEAYIAAGERHIHMENALLGEFLGHRMTPDPED